MEEKSDKDRMEFFIGTLDGERDNVRRKIRDYKCPVCGGKFELEGDFYSYEHHGARRETEKLDHHKDPRNYFLLAICNDCGNTLMFSLGDVLQILKPEQRI